MTVYAYHTPQVSTPINSSRAGTYRIGWNNPDPIQISKGWDAVLNFAFRNHTQKPYMTLGRTITARIYNTENVEVWNGTMVADPVSDGAAILIISNQVTNTFQAGLYSLVIEIEDDFGRTLLAQTAQSKPRFVVEVLDHTTVDLNE
jgi:hypothetical protein